MQRVFNPFYFAISLHSFVNSSFKAHPHLSSWSWGIASDALVWTPALSGLFGLDPSLPAPNQADQERLYTPESFALLQSANHRCRETGESYVLHLEGIHADGTTLHLEAYGAAERDAAGAITGLFGQFVDRTAEMRARKSLEEAGAKAEFANESRSRFLTNMGHEIRTPLNAIIGMAELLEYDSKRNDVKECLRTIHTSGDVLLSLVNDILDFSKIEAGQIKFVPAPVDIAQCVRESLTIISSTAAEKALEFDVLIDPELPRTIIADSLRIRQVLLNLLMNAVKFTERGRVTLGLSCTSDTEGKAIITFTVRDTGIGINDEEKRQLFKIFSQGDDSTSRRYGGTGLGLAFSQKLVEMMGGRISVTSSPGKGSSFSFSIPLIPTDETPAEPKSAPLPVTSFFLGMNAPLKILVAEDIKLNQQVIRLMLSRLGYDNVVLAENGLEVLDALHQGPFDLILMDIQMPLMNGLEATAAIFQKYQESEHPQIVALTANATPEDRTACLAAGMIEYLTKPLRREQLARVLQEVHARMPAKPPRAHRTISFD